MPTLTEADTCRTYVVPKLYAAGWTDDQISEQKSFTDGRIVVAGDKPRRRPSLVDFIFLPTVFPTPGAARSGGRLYTASHRAVAELKSEGMLPRRVRVQCSKYLNQVS